MLGELLAIERDPHRHALHHLDPVAARVLRRQQRECASRAGAEAGDAPMEGDGAAVGIGLQRHRLPGAQVRELVFLEVRVDPHVLERGDGHQHAPRRDALADLHRAPRDKARGRRGELGARESQVGFAHTRGAGEHVGVIVHLGAIHHRALRGELLLGGLQRGARRVHGVDRMLQLFARHRA